MKADDIQGFTREAERKPWMSWIGRHGRVPSMIVFISFVQLTELRPKLALELQLAQSLWLTKDCHIGHITII